MDTAVVFNVMHYSVHDGPGIRTTVFMKGCPLTCKWCHNPESLDPNPQHIFNAEKCINCGHCGGFAGGKADSGSCPTGARETIGYTITLAGLMEEIKKDLLFYEQSGGGVTFSGGEPFYQADFLLEALAQCRKEYMNTAIDTSGYCDTIDMLKAAEITNYFLYDFKFMDTAKHQEYCGVPNDLILKNLVCLAGTKARILLRIPVIPGINDDMKEMSGIFEFIKNLKNIEMVHLLPYHNIQANKYKKIGKEYMLPHITNEESPNISGINDLFSARFRTRIGG